MGGILRTSSDYDHNSFLMVVPSTQWKKALEIQADGLLNPLFDPDALKREVETILDETRERRDHPQGSLSEKLLTLGFAQHRIRRPPLGREDALRRLSPERLVEFHRNVYVPGRMVFVVSGDVNTSEILNETVRLYGKSRAGSERVCQSCSRTGTEQLSLPGVPGAGPASTSAVRFPRTSDQFGGLPGSGSVEGTHRDGGRVDSGAPA